VTALPLLVIGDSMLDRDVVGRAERLCPEQPAPVLEQESTRVAPGGAAQAAALLARDGHEVTLLTAHGADPAGDELSAVLRGAGVNVVNVGLEGTTPEKVRLRAGMHLLCRLDRGRGHAAPAARRSVAPLVAEAGAVLVSDYGGGITRDLRVRASLAGARHVVWDPHPRGSPPVRGMTLVTPNEQEARGFEAVGSVDELATRLRARWRAHAVCVTRGARGAVLASGRGTPLTITAAAVLGDPCGAGDRFAATATALLADGVPLADAVSAACGEAASYVAVGGWHGADPLRGAPGDDPAGLVERVRARGGTVVATGGCFDLLHAGHVTMLEAARRLGDALVVCLNSDRSVARVKGRDRPLVGEDDRAAVLRSLACVDAVVLFDEDTPAEVLRRLRPDVFVKGADYDEATLPEAAVMAEHGGRVTTVPYVAGRSTTGLIQKAGVHGL
jgi:D-beta-D-heptose 7-phosphate kinase / D-beta-D-heptose 1-phosphate adenosyltransferase